MATKSTGKKQEENETTVKFTESELGSMSPQQFRELVRSGGYRGPTDRYLEKDIGPCRGYADANLAIVPEEYAFELLLFCNRNPRPCPVIDVTEPGNPEPKRVAPGADLRTDVPSYRVFQNGEIVDEPTDIKKYWRKDLVAFLIGSSTSFDWSMVAANVKFQFIGVHKTTIECVPAGRFHGPMAVTTRLFPTSHDAIRAIQISSRQPEVHGPPVHIGSPAAIGIKELYKPDLFSYPEPVAPMKEGGVVLFWGCGVTLQTVALASKIPFMITHSPCHMFVTNLLSEELASF